MTEPIDQEPAEGNEAEDRTDWKAEARKWETRAKQNAEAAKRLAALEEAQKTAEQKAAERLAAAEKRAAEAELLLLKREIAEEVGLPKSWAARLQGTTKEEIEADAKALAKDLPAAAKPATGRPVPDLKSAALPAGEQQIMSGKDVDAWIRRQAGVA